MTALIPLTNTPRDYAWGTIDGVAHTLGWTPTGGPEAELWLGAHPLSPSRRAADTAADDGADAAAGEWTDLAQWEAGVGHPLPYLLKLLSAAHPLSLQAHPTPAQAAEGFAREEAAGIPLTARERNYKDPNAKPELIVAVDDGFEALCGFRPSEQTLALIDALVEALVSAVDAAGESNTDSAEASAALAVCREKTALGVREAFTWLLSGAPEVAAAVAAASAVAAARPRRFALIDRLARDYPGDPGVLVAQMLNHVTLAAGEALWLPAGNIHAYLRGTGVELMGPSDNVLRGGLTPKHVDRAELSAVLDFTAGDASYLAPIVWGENVVAYRPASMPSGQGVDFELLLVTGDAQFSTGSAAVALTVEGQFTVSADGTDAAGVADATVSRGDVIFIDEPAPVRVEGAGRLFVATGI